MSMWMRRFVKRQLFSYAKEMQACRHQLLLGCCTHMHLVDLQHESGAVRSEQRMRKQDIGLVCNNPPALVGERVHTQSNQLYKAWSDT